MYSNMADFRQVTSGPRLLQGVYGSSSKGRPSIELDVDNVKYLLSLGFSKSKVYVAGILGISRKTLYNKIAVFPN